VRADGAALSVAATWVAGLQVYGFGAAPMPAVAAQ